MASFKQALHLASGLFKLRFPIFIMEFHIRIVIDFVNSIKITLKLLGPASLTKSLLPPFFSTNWWFSNGINRNVALKSRTQ